jgi:hypothetical protein
MDGKHARSVDDIIADHEAKRQKSDHSESDEMSDGEEQRPTDLVVIGDYYDLPPKFDGYLPLFLLALSAQSPTADAPGVRIWAMGDVEGSKYWERKGSEAQIEKVAEEMWFPQIIANELQERILSEGEESVPRGEFIEEACNDQGISVLVCKPLPAHHVQKSCPHHVLCVRNTEFGILTFCFQSVTDCLCAACQGEAHCVARYVQL